MKGNLPNSCRSRIKPSSTYAPALARRKFSPISLPSLIGKIIFIPRYFLSFINDCINIYGDLCTSCIHLSYLQCPTSGNRLGCQERVIVCEEYHANNYGCSGKNISDSVCVNLGLRRPRSVRSCGGAICSLGTWIPDRRNVREILSCT